MVSTHGEPGLTAMLTVRQVCDILQVHHNTVRRWIATGRLAAYRVGPRGDLRLKPEDLSSFIEGQKIVAGGEGKN